MYKTCTYPQRRRTPSFSSSLLDSIYRSIDQPNVGVEEEEDDYPIFPSTTMTNKQSCTPVSSTTLRRSNAVVIENDQQKQHVSNLKRAIMIESWMEKHTTTTSRTSSAHSHNNSSSFSACTSSTRGGNGFSSSVFTSSSDADSVKQGSRRNPKIDNSKKSGASSSSSEGGGFTKTKLRALKIYGELKKVKQPISPGGRIASFLNSIFSSGSAKKVKMCSVNGMEDVSFDCKSKSTCSSVTSFSRSCLSKSSTNHSRGKSCGNNAAKRSVRFYPVGVIVDEDSRPCGHKCIYEDDPGLMPKIGKSASSKSNKNYQKKIFNELDFRGFQRYVEENYSEEEEENDDDDDESCSSSDLFELDHLIGIGRYREELPVYETTNLKRNQAIANGFIL